MQPGDASHRVHRFSHAEGSGWVSGCCANATRPRDELHFRPLRRSVSISSIAHELRACQGGRDSAGGTSRSDYWHSLAAACLVSLTLESELDEPKDAGANQYDSKDSRPKVPPPIYRAIVRGY
uniref:Uncharacterized protein n=2 Tax=Physcomitrium patens TaxID=3218 RepID=A0A2K1JLW6_PHYPA|nr:hypothetical protein PHYPA_017364 [Physcomitrium patens]